MSACSWFFVSIVTEAWQIYSTLLLISWIWPKDCDWALWVSLILPFFWLYYNHCRPAGLPSKLTFFELPCSHNENISQSKPILCCKSCHISSDLHANRNRIRADFVLASVYEIICAFTARSTATCSNAALRFSVFLSSDTQTIWTSVYTWMWGPCATSLQVWWCTAVGWMATVRVMCCCSLCHGFQGTSTPSSSFQVPRSPPPCATHLLLHWFS